MTIKEVKDLILKKNYSFEVSSDRPGVRYGKQRLETVEQIHGSFEEYLRQLARVQKKDQLGIQLYQPNGSSFLRKDFFLISIEPVVDSTKTVAPSTPSVASEPQKNTTKMDDITAKIENAQLKTEVRFLSEQVDALKHRNKQLDQKNDELTSQVTNMSRELATKGDKLDMEYRKKELDLLSEKKAGLSGLVEEVKNLPPEAWDFLSGVFLKNAPAKKTIDSSSTVPRHSDPDAQISIEAIYNLLVNKEPAIVGMIAMLTDYFCRYPDHLAITVQKFFPNETKDSAPSRNDDNDEEED